MSSSRMGFSLEEKLGFRAEEEGDRALLMSVSSSESSEKAKHGALENDANLY